MFKSVTRVGGAFFKGELIEDKFYIRHFLGKPMTIGATFEKERLDIMIKELQEIREKMDE